jgi:hypothetical protein
VNEKIGWVLAGLAFVAGWVGWGWRGLVLALTVVVFWMLLQFSRTMRRGDAALEAAARHALGGRHPPDGQPRAKAGRRHRDLSLDRFRRRFTGGRVRVWPKLPLDAAATR